MPKTLYHATTYENMQFILGYEEADPEFDEVNGFAPTVQAGFEGCAFLSEKPIDFECPGGTYHIAVAVPESVNLDEYRYFYDDDHYHCKNYAIPTTILNTWEMWREDILV